MDVWNMRIYQESTKYQLYTHIFTTIYRLRFTWYSIPGIHYVGKNTCPPYPGKYLLSYLLRSDNAERWLGEAYEKGTRCLTYALPPLLTLLL